jgi:hypothetical protein
MIVAYVALAAAALALVIGCVVLAVGRESTERRPGYIDLTKTTARRRARKEHA